MGGLVFPGHGVKFALYGGVRALAFYGYSGIPGIIMWHILGRRGYK